MAWFQSRVNLHPLVVPSLHACIAQPPNTNPHHRACREEGGPTLTVATAPEAGSFTLLMQAHMESSSSLQGPRALICCIQRSQMAYSRQKWPSRSAAAGSHGISFKAMPLRGSLKVLRA